VIGSMGFGEDDVHDPRAIGCGSVWCVERESVVKPFGSTVRKGG
jgi:hypothetical protein